MLVAMSVFGLESTGIECSQEGAGRLGWLVSKVEVDRTDKTEVQNGVVLGATKEVGLHGQWLYQSKRVD